MGVRIQLSSNFQVVELTYNSWAEVKMAEVESATNLVSELGEKIVVDKSNVGVKQSNKQVRVEMATEGQIEYLKRLGYTGDAAAMTKEEAWKYIKDHK